MRIAIDYTAAARQRAGIGRYARELVRALLAQESPHDFILMAAVAGLGEHWTHERAHVHAGTHAPGRLAFRPLPLTDAWVARIWQRLRIPIPAELVTGATDIFYSPDFVLPPLRRRTRAVLTVHDLSFLRHPETFSPPLRAYLERAVPRSVARADHVFADSDATRRDLIELLGAPAERVTTLYSGISSGFDPHPQAGERERLSERYGVGERSYILSVGTVQPRKNYVRLMEACAPLAEGHAVELVIVGRPAWLSEPILEAAQRRPYVRMLGFCDDTDLPALYRQAALFAFPSLYEGFGIPPLEAMACGTPVVASAASSVPEVVGEAGLLVDPADVAAWTEALARVLEDSTLRARLREAGLHRAAEFTWARAAQAWLRTVAPLAN